MSASPSPSYIEAEVFRVKGGAGREVRDLLAVESPLELRARVGDEVRVVSTTMRTPGDDRALAAGFLFAERVIASAEWLQSVECVGDDAVVVRFAAPFARAAEAALHATERRFVTSGACGVCGRESLEALMEVPTTARGNGTTLRLPASLIHGLPAILKKAQATFAQTGGLHAAALFSAPDGELRAVHEDVGRHNAVDKLVGGLLLKNGLPAGDVILLVSGRASFELAQKAAMAGFPVMAAVGAPSSLAVEVARRAGITLLGFVRDGGFNVYCGGERLDGFPGQFG
ncbi:MAG: formate dehydrogenase accessory sulfurtransferase FdhD [Polyangia bacterium]